MKTPFLPLLLTPFLVLGCGEKNPEELGYEALQDGRYEEAMVQLLAAYSGVEKGTPKHRELGVTYFQAMAHVSPEKCRSGFLKVIELGHIVPTERDFETVAGELMQTQAFTEAARVVDAGIKAFPDNTRLPEFIEKLVKMAKQGDRPELASTLLGMGYGGGE